MKLSILHNESPPDPATASAIIALTNAVWPVSDRTTETLVAELGTGLRETPLKRHYLIHDGAELVAHAVTFSRVIRFDGGSLEVMALAEVCVDPARRGEGHGARVVREAFRQVDEGPFAVSLFQTNVPGFYERLGAVKVANRFTDSTAGDPEANPWWNDHVMVYPAFPGWPAGIIDLCGRGY